MPELRDTLFGDLPLEAWPSAEAESRDVFPWSAFVTAREHWTHGRRAEAVAGWREILSRGDLEPRHHLQAWHFLRNAAHAPAPEVGKQVLGVVVEVALPEGLDLLAAYPDHRARYYNYAGGGVVWERPNPSLDGPIDDVLGVARQIVEMIGPWDQERPAAPPRDQARLSFLTPSGLHFGQGPLKDLAADPMAGLVLKLATRLMQDLIATTGRK